MEIEKAIFNYYKDEIDKVKSSVPIFPERDNKKIGDRIYNAVFAAAIALASLFLVTSIRTPSELADRSAEFYVYHNLDTIIPAGLVKINKFVSKSFQSGGEK